MINPKSTYIAYLLFFIGGMFAWHLLYLKRSRQAVLYCCTFGGFGMGLLYDLLNIPRYVSEANLDEDYVELHLAKRHQRRIDIQWERCVAEVVFGCILGFGILSACPESWVNSHWTIYYLFLCVITPAMTAYGVWFIGGIGSQRLDFTQSLCGAVLTLPLLLRSGPSNLFYTALSSAIWSNYRGNRLRTMEEINLEQKQSYFTHIFKFGCFLFFVYAMWFSTFYNNATITTNDGVEVPVKEAVSNFLKLVFSSSIFLLLMTFSKQFASLSRFEGRIDFVMTLFSNGPGQAWRRFLRISDPLGEDAAFQALELEPGASEAEIEKQCRKLLRDHHPDRFQDEDRKKQEHNIFLNVQVACDRLSAIRQRRIQRNRQSVTKEEL